MQEKIKQLSKEIFPEVVRFRRHFHANPELSTQEFKTAEFIAKILGEHGIVFEKNWAETGIVAVIEGAAKAEKKINVALRADMDALPMQEENDVPYKSMHKNIMHACGHDAHMACLLGSLIILNKIKNEFSGKIIGVFQPSEETFPGGAIRMIEQGFFEKFNPQIMIALHVLPELQAGEVGIKTGNYMASTDEIYLKVIGKGGHAATPSEVIDPIIISAHILTALQQIVSRRASPIVPSVLSFGRIEGKGRTNIIPDFVLIDGTFRTFDETWRKKAHALITDIAEKTAIAMGGSCEVNIKKGYPALFNHIELTKKIQQNATRFLGKDKVIELQERMTAEDFAYFAQKVPSCMFRLGTRKPNQASITNLHANNFDIDENALETGIGLMAWLAWNS